MKTKLLLLAALIAAALLGSGCTSSSYATKLAKFEEMGVTEIHVTGKFSSTDYTVTEQDGQRVAVFEHNNAWVPKVRVVRKTPAAPQK